MVVDWRPRVQEMSIELLSIILCNRLKNLIPSGYKTRDQTVNLMQIAVTGMYHFPWTENCAIYRLNEVVQYTNIRYLGQIS